MLHTTCMSSDLSRTPVPAPMSTDRPPSSLCLAGIMVFNAEQMRDVVQRDIGFNLLRNHGQRHEVTFDGRTWQGFFNNWRERDRVRGWLSHPVNINVHGNPHGTLFGVVNNPPPPQVRSCTAHSRGWR